MSIVGNDKDELVITLITFERCSMFGIREERRLIDGADDACGLAKVLQCGLTNGLIFTLWNICFFLNDGLTVQDILQPEVVGSECAEVGLQSDRDSVGRHGGNVSFA